MRRFIAAAMLAAASATHAANPAFQPRDLNGDGVVDAYFDTAQNLTWLADTNFAHTTGYIPPGGWSPYEMYPDGIYRGMDAGHANQWAEGLDIYGVTGWRLPRAFGDCSSPDACDVSSELELLPRELPPTFGGRFQTGNTVPCFILPGQCQLIVDVPGGRTFLNGELIYPFGSWAVHDGDIAPVPEPSTGVLLGLGLAAVLGRNRVLARDDAQLRVRPAMNS